MTEIERYKAALQVAISGLRQLGLDYSNHTDRVERAVDAILNPPVEMEDVPIERWVCLKCGKSYEYEASLCSCYPTGSSTGSYVPVKLTGTLTRPKPVKEERSVSGEVRWAQCEGFIYPVGKNIDFDWESIIGKTGYLTFTWTE